MSRSKNSTPPDAMTWKRATPILVICGIFDLARAFFSMFWLFGPVLAAMYCVGGASGIWGKVLGTLCSGAGAAAGYFLSPALMLFGTVMAMAIGLVGWMLVYLILVMSNLRIFQVGAGSVLTMMASLVVGEMPLINAIPTLTIATAKLYRAQIKREAAALKAWEQAHTAQLQQEREEQRQQMVQAQQAQAQAEAEEDEIVATEEAEIQQEEDAKAEEEQQVEPAQKDSSYGAARTGSQQRLSEDYADTQFDTIQDALSELNNKQNRTLEENARLLKARTIMERVTLNPDDAHDPVLHAAYERATQGQKVFDGSPETRNGFKFINVRKTR